MEGHFDYDDTLGAMVWDGKGAHFVPAANLPAELGGPVAKEIITEDEYIRFRDRLPTYRDRLIAMVFRNTGLRVNELLSIEARQCYLRGPDFIIYIRRSKKRVETPFEPMHLQAELGLKLRDYIEGQAMKPTDLVFGNASRSRDSHKITRRGLAFVFAKAGMESIGRPVQAKEFRSLFVKSMIRRQVPMEMASKMLGHEDIRTTQRHYLALSGDERRAIAEGIPV